MALLSKQQVSKIVKDGQARGLDSSDIILKLMDDGHVLEGLEGMSKEEVKTPRLIVHSQQINTVEKEDKTFGGFVKNIGSSGLELGKDLVDMVAHPIETGKGAIGLAAGTFSKINPFLDLDEEVYAEALWELTKERYGSYDKFLETSYEDPVGVLFDASILFSAGGTAAAKLGKIGSSSKLGKYATMTKNQKRAAIAADMRKGEFGELAKQALRAKEFGDAINPLSFPIHGAKLATKVVHNAFNRWNKNISANIKHAEFLSTKTGKPVKELQPMANQVMNLVRENAATRKKWSTRMIEKMKAVNPDWKNISGGDLLAMGVVNALTGSGVIASVVLGKITSGLLSKHKGALVHFMAGSPMAMKTTGATTKILKGLHAKLKEPGLTLVQKEEIRATIRLIEETQEGRELFDIKVKAENNEELTDEEWIKLFGEPNKISPAREYTEEELIEQGIFNEGDFDEPTSVNINLVKKLTDAIIQTESGGRQIKGGSGEFGLAQFLPETWKTISIEMTGSVLEQTPENERMVVEAKIKQLLEKGYSPHEVALIWNTSLGGQEQPYVRKGINQHGVEYDSLAYANEVISNLKT
jgi:hypothetical protein